jgi:RNA polymerase sigma-70 factor (sigma-E family)
MSFEDFMRARLPALMRYAVLLTGDRELAADLVQEVMIRAHRKWRRVSAADRPELYVRRMLTNAYLSHRRRKAVSTVALTFEALDGPAAVAHPDHADQHAARAELWQHLAILPARQRAVLVLRYYEGFSNHEIADLLGCADSSVRSSAARALAALRVELAGSPALTSGEDR